MGAKLFRGLTMTIAEPVVGSPPRRNGAAFREADSAPDGHMSAETLGTLLGQVSKPSLDEIDDLVKELQGLPRKLQTDSDRIRR
jgi:hypothetical protein